MFKNPLKVARVVVEHGTSIGASLVVVAALRSNIPVVHTPVMKVLHAMGIYGLSGVAGALAAEHSTSQFDQLVAIVKGAPTTK